MNDPKSKELSSGTESSDTGAELQASTVDYDIVALSTTIYFNREGDHDHNGMLFVLEANVPILEYIEALARQGSRPRPGVQTPNLQTLFAEAAPRAQDIEVHLPLTPEQARGPHPLVRPLVLRARLGDTVKVTLRNQIRDRDVGLHLVSGGYDVETSDGSHVGANPATLAGFGSTQIYTCVL